MNYISGGIPPRRWDLYPRRMFFKHSRLCLVVIFLLSHLPPSTKKSTDPNRKTKKIFLFFYRQSLSSCQVLSSSEEDDRQGRNWTFRWSVRRWCTCMECISLFRMGLQAIIGGRPENVCAPFPFLSANGICRWRDDSSYGGGGLVLVGARKVQAFHGIPSASFGGCSFETSVPFFSPALVLFLYLNAPWMNSSSGVVVLLFNITLAWLHLRVQPNLVSIDKYVLVNVAFNFLNFILY